MLPIVLDAKNIVPALLNNTFGDLGLSANGINTDQCIAKVQLLQEELNTVYLVALVL